MADEGGDEAAQAFEALRAEVSDAPRCRAACAERTEQPEPSDYSETLGVTSNNLTATAQRIDALVNSPALKLTPDTFSRQMVSVSSSEARAADQRALATVRQAFNDAAFRLSGYVASARAAYVQDRWLYGIDAAGLILGMLIWAAGQDLMASAGPRRWDGIVAGDTIVAANRDALAACQRAVTKAKKPVRCTIEVKVVGA